MPPVEPSSGPGIEADLSPFLPARWAFAGRQLGWHNVVAGFLGCAAMAVAGPAIVLRSGGPFSRWWFDLAVPPLQGALGDYLLGYAGMVAFSAAWLAVGRRLRRATSLRTSDLWALGALWSLPLVFGPPLFSRDLYSYLAQGMLAHLHMNPYRYPAASLVTTPAWPLATVVSPVWQLTTAPYGPVFLWLAAGAAAVTRVNVAGGVALLRLPEVAGVAIAAICLPRLARRLGADPLEAVWIGALSPLVLLDLVAAGHNDALMTGLLVAGLVLAMERRPLLAIAACTAATLVKAPAVAGVAFVTFTWLRERQGARAKLGGLAAAGAVVAAGLAIGSTATGLGFGWVSPRLLSIPSQVRIPTSPVTGLAALLAFLAHRVGLPATSRGVSGALGPVLFGLGAVVTLVLLARSKPETMVPSLGFALLVIVLLGPVVWPWYLTWGLVPLAAWAPAQRHGAFIAVAGLSTFVLTPSGGMAVPGALAPLAGVAWVAVALITWRRWRARLTLPALR